MLCLRIQGQSHQLHLDQRLVDAAPQVRLESEPPLTRTVDAKQTIKLGKEARYEQEYIGSPRVESTPRGGRCRP